MTPAATPTRPLRPWRRRVRRAAIALACGYAACVAVLLGLEDRLVYMATPSTTSRRVPPDLGAEDVDLVSADGTRLHAWWCPRDGARGAVLFCHGQKGNLTHRAGFVPLLQRELGLSVLLFDYPGFGRSEGRPTEAGCCAAADAAYDWLVREKNISTKEIVIIGKSLGGGVATDLAARRPNRALVLCMTFTSLPDAARHLIPVVPAGWLMRNRFDNLDKIARCKGAVFITHGTADWKVPPSHSERLFAAAPEPKRYFPMEGVGHGRPCFTDECLAELRDFLRSAAR